MANEKARLGTGRRFSAAVGRYWQLYLMMALPILWLLLFAYKPMGGLYLAFSKYSARAGLFGGKFVGLKYFERFVNSYQFTEIMRNTFVISFYSVLASMPIPIILALSLNAVRGSRYKKTVQMLSYMPHFISTVVIVSMLLQLFNPRTGMIGALYGMFGAKAPNLFAQPSAFPHLYVWSGVWQNTGWSSIIYLAALAGVDPELHEAAIVDGASRMQRVRFIDFPSIIPTASILLIMNMGRVMSIGFEKVFLMQNPLNLSVSEIVSTYTYKIGLTGNVDYSYSTAIGLFNSLINLTLILSTNAISKKISGSGLF